MAPRHNYLILMINIHPMNKIKSLSVANLVSFLIHAATFYAIHFQVINEKVVHQITNPYHSLLSAEEEFAAKVWGVIYTLLAIFCLYEVRMAFSRPLKHTANYDIARINIFFIINNLAGAGWLATVAYGQGSLSVGLLAIQLGSLVLIHRRLTIYKRYRRIRSNICTQIPLSIYLGWLTAIAVRGIGVYLDLASERWTIILIGAIGLIALLVMFLRHNIFFVLAVIAALYGMIIKLELYKGDIYDIILAAWISFWALAVASVIKLTIDFRLRAPPRIFNSAYD